MRLGVNVDHVATLRQARRIDEPDPVTAAAIAELTGAHSIIVHLREDRRHIQDRDLEILRKTVKTKLNLEMAAAEEIIRIAVRVKPDIATIVPERREELTTESGLNVLGHFERLKKSVEKLKKGGIAVSLFVDPNPSQIRASKRIGVNSIEINTGRYSEAKDDKEMEKELTRIISAVDEAKGLKLNVAAGHGLNYRNVSRIAEIEGIEELNIGHSIISRAVFVGLEQAVREMLALII